MYKKRILIVIIIITILYVMTVISNAADGVITGETVKLRNGPSLEAGLVTLLSVDDDVEVLSKEGDWYQVRYEDYEGYVYADYVEVEGNVPENTTSNNNTQVTNNIIENEIENNLLGNTTTNEVNNIQNEINNTITNNTIDTITDNNSNVNNIVGTNQILIEDTNLKILPLINAENLEYLTKDTNVTVNDEANGWAFVSTDMASGWVRIDKLAEQQSLPTTQEQEPITEPEETEEQTETTTIIGYINVGSVNVRENASTSSNIITTLTRNTEVRVEKVENGWARISTSTGINGYVSNQYISDEREQETNRGSVERERETIELPNTTENEVENTEVETTKTSRGEEVANYAQTLLGKSYVYGGVGPNSFDCSGFTEYVYSKFGVNLTHSASAQANIGTTVSKSNLQLGDMVFFTQGGSSIGHVGIYIGNNSFIHAANPQKGVVITSLSDGYYTRNYKTAKRVI